MLLCSVEGGSSMEDRREEGGGREMGSGAERSCPTLLLPLGVWGAVCGGVCAGIRYMNLHQQEGLTSTGSRGG